MVYDAQNKARWAAGVGGKAKGRDCAFVVQNDRNMVIYADQEPLWCSRTHYDPNKATAYVLAVYFFGRGNSLLSLSRFHSSFCHYLTIFSLTLRFL